MLSSRRVQKTLNVRHKEKYTKNNKTTAETEKALQGVLTLLVFFLKDYMKFFKYFMKYFKGILFRMGNFKVSSFFGYLNCFFTKTIIC